MYTLYTLRPRDPAHTELLVALLAEAGFEAFEEREEQLLAYALTDAHRANLAALEKQRERLPFTFTHEVQEERNWNEVWEGQFHPIRIGDRLLIRAGFHPPEAGFEQELVIDPKMAFGTGHHATTHMMCELLFDYRDRVAGARSLDYGCGTGVLAILGKKLGGGAAGAVDIEAPSYENTIENAATNGVLLEEVIHGTLEDVPRGAPYDLILANINRNVILATAGSLYKRLRPGGLVFVSGILERDEDLIVERLTRAGFDHHDTRSRADWRAFVFSRP